MQAILWLGSTDENHHRQQQEILQMIIQLNIQEFHLIADLAGQRTWHHWSFIYQKYFNLG